MRRLTRSCRPLRLMYPQSFLVTSVLGMSLPPITPASVGLGVIGFMNAAFGLRALFFFAGFFAALLTFFFEAFAFLAFAIMLSRVMRCWSASGWKRRLRVKSACRECLCPLNLASIFSEW